MNANEEALQALQPLYALDNLREWNAGAARELARRIAPRNVRDLTVGELLDLIERVPA